MRLMMQLHLGRTSKRLSGNLINPQLRVTSTKVQQILTKKLDRSITSFCMSIIQVSKKNSSQFSRIPARTSGLNLTCPNATWAKKLTLGLRYQDCRTLMLKTASEKYSRNIVRDWAWDQLELVRICNSSINSNSSKYSNSQSRRLKFLSSLWMLSKTTVLEVNKISCSNNSIMGSISLSKTQKSRCLHQKDANVTILFARREKKNLQNLRRKMSPTNPN